MSTNNTTGSQYYGSNMVSNIVPNPEFSLTSTPRSRPRFGYYAPPSYPRPRSSASKPNPHNTSFENDVYSGDRSYSSGNSSYATCPEFMGDQSFNTPVSMEQESSVGTNETALKTVGVSKENLAMQQIFNALIQGAAKETPKRSDQLIRKRKAPGHQGQPAPPMRCDICNLSLSCPTTLDMHLRGSKHLKKIKAMESLRNLQSQGIARDATLAVSKFYCEICDISVNSAIQLQIHNEGTKHKNKVYEDALTVTYAVSEKKPNGSVPNGKSKSLKMYQCELCGVIANTLDMLEVHYNGSKHKNKLANKAKNISVAEGEISGPIPVKVPKFGCDVCGIAVNSNIQLQQHVQSKKHEAKLTGQPLGRKKKSAKCAEKSEILETVSIIPPLSLTFVQSKATQESDCI